MAGKTTPAFYKDFNKPADSILNDDYSLKRTLKVKFVTPDGVTITTENELAGKDNKYDLKAKISGKYKHGRTGFSIDKLQMKETGGLVGEFSLANVAPGLVFAFKGEEKPTGELGVEYTGNRFAVKAEADLVQLAKAKASAVVAHEGGKVGGDVEIGLPDGTNSLALNKWSVGTAYGTATSFASVVAASGKSGIDYSVFGVWKTSPPLALAGKLTVPNGSDYGLTVGGVYRASPRTTLKSKVNLAGILATSIIHDVHPKVQVTATAEGSVKTASDYKIGFGAVLG